MEVWADCRLASIKGTVIINLILQSISQQWMEMLDFRVKLLFTAWEEHSEWFKALNSNFQSRTQRTQQVKFTKIKSCLARFSGISALGTSSNIHSTAISYGCAKFGAFVKSVTILTLRDLTISRVAKCIRRYTCKTHSLDRHQSKKALYKNYTSFF